MTSSSGIKREGERRVSLEHPRDATWNVGRLDTSVQAHFVQALSNLDNLLTPCPKVYTEGSAQSFADFLLSFEQYSTTNFFAGKYLKGDLMTAYKVLRVPS